jgi:hypothetical protein
VLFDDLFQLIVLKHDGISFIKVTEKTVRFQGGTPGNKNPKGEDKSLRQINVSEI